MRIVKAIPSSGRSIVSIEKDIEKLSNAFFQPFFKNPGGITLEKKPTKHGGYKYKLKYTYQIAIQNRKPITGTEDVDEFSVYFKKNEVYIIHPKDTILNAILPQAVLRNSEIASVFEGVFDPRKKAINSSVMKFEDVPIEVINSVISDAIIDNLQHNKPFRTVPLIFPTKLYVGLFTIDPTAPDLASVYKPVLELGYDYGKVEVLLDALNISDRFRVKSKREYAFAGTVFDLKELGAQLGLID